MRQHIVWQFLLCKITRRIDEKPVAETTFLFISVGIAKVPTDDVKMLQKYIIRIQLKTDILHGETEYRQKYIEQRHNAIHCDEENNLNVRRNDDKKKKRNSLFGMQEQQFQI